ncbi:BRCT domain-containing protein [Enterococcus sp. AZ180]|uniref:BRCT domain-containing protein n=1 Tax=Enterococcus sp. AZ180 TaxID=2774961 RepID=UPI003F20E37D
MKRLALTKDGKMTYCQSSDENVGKGRCNHVDHQKDGESSDSFIARIEESKVEEKGYAAATKETPYNDNAFIEGKVFALATKVPYGFANQAAFKKYIEDSGGKFQSRVDENVDYVITSKETSSPKQTYAEENNLPTMDISDFYKKSFNNNIDKLMRDANMYVMKSKKAAAKALGVTLGKVPGSRSFVEDIKVYTDENGKYLFTKLINYGPWGGEWEQDREALGRVLDESAISEEVVESRRTYW